MHSHTLTIVYLTFLMDLMEIWPCNTSFLCRFYCGILGCSTTFYHTKKIRKNYLNEVDFCVGRFLSMTILSVFRLFFVTLTSKCVLYMHFDLLVIKNYLRNLSQSPNLASATLELAFASFQKRCNSQIWPLQLGTKITIDSQISQLSLLLST